jgi:SH3-like domain-containing protein
MTRKVISTAVFLMCFLIGCTSQASTPTAIPAATQPPIAQATFTPEPTITPTIILSPTPFVPFKVTTAVDYVNIRTNPGYLFSVQENVSTGTELEVLGRCPGGEWINVRTSSGSTGWVFHMLLQSAQDLQTIPIVQPQSVQLVTGKVVDANGQPVSGIVFNVLRGTGADAPVTNAVTDPSGVFYAFMPISVSGEWQVNYAGIGCSSNLMNENCDCKNGTCGMPDPTSQTITLPQSQPLVFSWK